MKETWVKISARWLHQRLLSLETSYYFMHCTRSLSFKFVLIHPTTSILFNAAHVYGNRGRKVHMVKQPGLPLAFSCCHGRRRDCHWVGLCFLGSVCSNLSSQQGECVESAVTDKQTYRMQRYKQACGNSPEHWVLCVYIVSEECVPQSWTWEYQNIYLQCKQEDQQICYWG